MKLIDGILPYLPAELIRACYGAAPGNEIGSGKFLSPESSAALSANAFGYFLEKPTSLPPIPVDREIDWPPRSVTLEAECRFPWSGGRHPWLDVVVETDTALIGIESKRYEPFRTHKGVALSNAYWRPVWGEHMNGYCSVRDGLRSGDLKFDRLDAAQLVKHALGLRSVVHRNTQTPKQPYLIYLYAEPQAWPNGREVPKAEIHQHRDEIERFSRAVDGDEVAFHSLSYRELLASWTSSSNADVRDHANAVQTVFAP